MRSRMMCGSLALLLTAVAPRIGMAAMDQESPPVERVDRSERVLQYNLAGPRIGVTFDPEGRHSISQFGWHFENQVAPGKHGPWFIVERVFLIGGLERNAFVPNGTLIFGMRLPNSFEFGVGPSVTLGGMQGFNSGLVAAIGHSYRIGGIRVPVNVAVAPQKDGSLRWTLITGWAVRDRVTPQTVAPQSWPSHQLERGDS